MLCSTPHSIRSEAKMPRYEYRVLNPMPSAEKAFLAWVDRLDQEFMNPDPEHRSNFVRDALHELYLGRPYSTPNPSAGLAEQALVHSFDPRNATLEPEYYGDVDAVKYAERKARVTYHATVLSGVRVAEHGMVGSLGVAAKDVPPFNVVAGIPAKTIKVKSIAPEEVQKAAEKSS